MQCRMYFSALALLLTACGEGNDNSPAPTPVPTAAPTAAPTPMPTPTPAPNNTQVDFGANVLVFDPGMSSAAIQTQINNIYSQQHTNQFGSNRFAMMFKPGNYPGLDINVGFYTHVLGLGSQPDDVQIGGDVHVEADWLNTSQDATQNFWRIAENMAVTPVSGTDRWAVSQAAPMRRMHIKGGMILSSPYCGYSSGGFLADTLIDSTINSCSQQQWVSRNSQWANWVSGVWNMVFVGVVNPPASGTWPATPYTVIPQTPVSREKPYLTIDGEGHYGVFVPALASNTQGTTWLNQPTPGHTIAISDFYVAKENVDTAQTLNAALAAGKHLLFTPGIYHLTDTLRVTQPGTVILGLGLATLQPDTGQVAMDIADVDGVTVAGLIFDAGAQNSPVLLKVGNSINTTSHASNPGALFDLYFRVGGSHLGQASICLQINSNDVIGDNMWIWRADHSDINLVTTGWAINPAANGLVVNGNNVTIYGLAVEHFQQYQTLWNGNGGRVYFYQSESPYDVPNQAAWMNGTENGYPSYKVANTVTSHHAYGMGVYTFYVSNPALVMDNAFEAPQVAGVAFTDLITVSLDGTSRINNVINGTGGSNTGQNATLPTYP